eukprot:TRINITY_DN1418_c0_g1_i1.p1 TRINITY_DN1418_c0_g1~~TRINITY_DN1418_c0_g1_i1.p1  ORF type:complete len:426 (+),score=94.34 TRINITY_DN1418_c0_g1_i1:23-1279(+)
MSAYSDQVLTEKLEKLNNSQQSIQTLCHWVMYHRKRSKQSVEIWDREMRKATKDRKLTFLYLANDIMQNSRKRGGEFINEFGRVLKNALGHICTETGPQIKPAIDRLINIWDERRVFQAQFITELKTEVQGQAQGQEQPQIIKTDEHKKSHPLGIELAEIDELSVITELFGQRVAQIRPEILTTDILNNITSKDELSEPAQEVEDAYNNLQTYVNRLEDDLARRSKLIDNLTQCLLQQQLERTNISNKIDTCRKQLSDIGSVKEGMKTLYEGYSTLEEPHHFQTNSHHHFLSSLSHPLSQSLLNTLEKVADEGLLPIQSEKRTFPAELEDSNGFGSYEDGGPINKKLRSDSSDFDVNAYSPVPLAHMQNALNLFYNVSNETTSSTSHSSVTGTGSSDGSLDELDSSPFPFPIGSRQRS